MTFASKRTRVSFSWGISSLNASRVARRYSRGQRDTPTNTHIADHSLPIRQFSSIDVIYKYIYTTIYTHTRARALAHITRNTYTHVHTHWHAQNSYVHAYIMYPCTCVRSKTAPILLSFLVSTSNIVVRALIFIIGNDFLFDIGLGHAKKTVFHNGPDSYAFADHGSFFVSICISISVRTSNTTGENDRFVEIASCPFPYVFKDTRYIHRRVPSIIPVERHLFTV